MKKIKLKLQKNVKLKRYSLTMVGGLPVTKHHTLHENIEYLRRLPREVIDPITGHAFPGE